MTVELPAPLVPAEVELRDFQFMPLDIARLRRSKAWLICKRRPELAFYMINLWTAAWHDTPAGSLEDDDDVLADLAMCSAKDWPKLRRDILRGWTKCSDGRLYHTVVVEKVIEAWNSKLQYAYNRECGRLRKAAGRAGKKDFIPPTFEEWDALRLSSGQPELSSGQLNLSKGQAQDVFEASHLCPPENALKGQVRDSKVKGQGYTQGDVCVSAGQIAPDPDRERERKRPGLVATHPARSASPGLLLRLQDGYPAGIYRQSDWTIGDREAQKRIEEGESEERLIAAKDRYRAQCDAKGIIGTQFVMSPARFFARPKEGGDPPYLDDFPLPATKADVRLQSNIDAAQEFLRRTDPGT